MKNYISLFAITACLILHSHTLVKNPKNFGGHSFHEFISFQNMFKMLKTFSSAERKVLELKQKKTEKLWVFPNTTTD